MNTNLKYFNYRNKLESLKNLNSRHERSFLTINNFLKFSNLPKVDKNSQFLDLGCGDGSYVNFLNRKEINALGCDINISNFEIDRLPYENEKFSHVMMYSVIEHVNNTSNLLNESKRILKKNGCLIIITPNFRYAYLSFYDDPTHLKPFTDIGLSKILDIYGFKNIIVKPWTVNFVNFIWKLPFSFFFANYLIPFRNDNNKFIPKILKGKSSTMIAACSK